MSQRQNNRAGHDQASVTRQTGGSGQVLAAVTARRTDTGRLTVAR